MTLVKWAACVHGLVLLRSFRPPGGWLVFSHDVSRPSLSSARHKANPSKRGDLGSCKSMPSTTTRPRNRVDIQISFCSLFRTALASSYKATLIQRPLTAVGQASPWLALCKRRPPRAAKEVDQRIWLGRSQGAAARLCCVCADVSKRIAGHVRRIAADTAAATTLV